MRYQTDLMRAILTNETAQEIIDWVSQLYGDSYVGLWIYQVLGVVLGEVRAMAEQLRQEVSPSTAKELLDLWEESYGLTIGDGLTTEQRQTRLMDRKLNRSPANPSKLEQVVRSFTGCEAKVTENVAPYTFTAEVYCNGAAVDFDTVLEQLRRIKPSHQQMQLCMTASVGIEIKAQRTPWPFPYRMTGTYPQVNTVGGLTRHELDVKSERTATAFPYPMTGELLAGTHPQVNTQGIPYRDSLEASVETITAAFEYPLCGDSDA